MSITSQTSDHHTTVEFHQAEILSQRLVEAGKKNNLDKLSPKELETAQKIISLVQTGGFLGEKAQVDEESLKSLNKHLGTSGTVSKTPKGGELQKTLNKINSSLAKQGAVHLVLKPLAEKATSRIENIKSFIRILLTGDPKVSLENMKKVINSQTTLLSPEDKAILKKACRKLAADIKADPESFKDTSLIEKKFEEHVSLVFSKQMGREMRDALKSTSLRSPMQRYLSSAKAEVALGVATGLVPMIIAMSFKTSLGHLIAKPLWGGHGNATMQIDKAQEHIFRDLEKFQNAEAKAEKLLGDHLRGLKADERVDTSETLFQDKTFLSSFRRY